jgi:hypothetical protein
MMLMVRRSVQRPAQAIFGAQAYDFSGGSLVTYAQRAKNDTAAIKSLEKAVRARPAECTAEAPA